MFVQSINIVQAGIIAEIREMGIFQVMGPSKKPAPLDFTVQILLDGPDCVK